MNIVKIFLASSIVEFEQERDKLAARIRGMNNALIKNGVYLELQLCEDWTHAWSQGRKQEEFNDLIRDCHFFFAIVGKKVGKATQEEIDVAFLQFRESGSLKQPRIIVFFQKTGEGEETPDADVFALQARVREAGQYDVSFSNVSEIYGEILTELFISDAVLNPEVLETNKKSHLAVLLKIRKNRGKIAKLSKGPITEDAEAELLVLYRENMVLTESELAEWGTLYEYAAFLHKRGYHAKAAEVGERLDAHYTAEDDADARAKLKKLLGDCYMSQGQHENAETRYRAALELYRELAERKEKKYRADVAETCEKLAEIMIQTFRYEAAERLYRESLEYCLGDAEKYAREIALSCHSLQKLMKPERNAETAILHRAEQTAVHCAVQRVRGQMGAVKENLRYWLETFPCPDTAAERMAQIEAKARELTKDAPEGYEPTLALSYLHTGMWLREHNQMESAETLICRALEICQKLAEKDAAFKPSCAASCNSLALMLNKTNRPIEAERHYQKAIQIERKLAEKDPTQFEHDLAVSYNNLALLFKDTTRYGEAELYHREALEMRRRLAKKDPMQFESDLASSYDNLAELFRDTARYEEAEPYYREALEMRRRLAKKDPMQFESDLASSCNNFASLLYQTARYGEAEQYCREALAIRRRLAKKDPEQFEPDLAASCFNYGLLLMDQKSTLTDALACFNEAVALLEKYPHYEKKLNDALQNRSFCQQEIWKGDKA